MKKTFIGVIILILLLSMVGCSTQPASTGAAPVAEDSVNDAATAPDVESVDETKDTMKIGMLVSTLQYDFFVYLADGMKEAFEAEGWEFTVMSYDNDANKAISIIENFTIEGVDAIIAMVGDKSTDTALQAAMDQGIVVVEAGVLTDAYTIGMVADNKDVGTKIGEMAADYVNNELDGNAKVVTIISQSNSDMVDRSNAMVDALTVNAPNAEIVGSITYVSVGDATAAMENFLQQYPDINVVVSFGDAGALEAVEVAKAANKAENFGAFGCDATEQALNEIAAGGLMKGTVDMGSLISLMSEPTIQYLKGDTTVPKITSGVNTKVTAENISDYVK